ncbi:hypothetical protein L208DRAFT_419391 [Tricholoma matsutake]|nr:hypothetical protein L208DRAFT_419391 [Tricholoma matsutake 945]
MTILSHIPSRAVITEINSLPLPLQVLYHCFDGIASYVPIPTVISLSRTHTSLTDKLSNHLRRSFEGLLRSRISAPKIGAFCSLLLDTRAVISGSTALHFILRDSHWRPGDFDLYTPFGTGYAVVRWLVVNEGYEIVSDGSSNFAFHPATVPMPASAGPCDWLTDFDSDILSAPPKCRPDYDFPNPNIYRVYKLSSSNNTFIDVVESLTPSFLPTITKFHSTLVMNYLTPTSIVVLYPTLTFKREGILQYRGGVEQGYVQKYEARGFTLHSHPVDRRQPCGAACSLTSRIVGSRADKWSLEVDFGATRISSEPSRIGTVSDLQSLPVASEIPAMSGRSYDNPKSADLLTQGSSQSNPRLMNRSPSPRALASSDVIAPLDPIVPNVIPRAGQNGSENPSTLSSKVMCRPSLPPTTWALTFSPHRQVKGMCINPFCFRSYRRDMMVLVR